MANKKISELDSLGEAPATNDVLPMVDTDSSSTKKVTVENFSKGILSTTSVVTESDSISSNDNDTTLPTSAAVKDYVDNGSSLTFTGLTDTPSSLTADKWLKVNSAGTALEETAAPEGTSSWYVQRFDGDGSTVAFTLSQEPASENNTQVYISGVYQQKDTYSVSTTTLTFSEAPETGTGNIEVVTNATSAIGTTTSDLVTFSPAGTGATNRTTQAKLRDVVSVKDFGAVGDGTTDDSTAIQAAITAAVTAKKSLYVPSGIYKCTTALSVNSSSAFFFKIYGEYGSRATEVDPSDPSTATGSIIWFNGITSGDCFAIGSGTGEAMSPVLEDLFFLGDADNGVTPVTSNTTTGIHLNKSRNTVFRNVNIRGFFCGMKTTASWTASMNDVHVDRCHIGTRLTTAANLFKFNHCAWTDTTYGVLHEEGSAVEFQNCWWQGQGSTAQRYMKSAVVAGGSGSTQINSLNFSNCYFEELRDEAIQLGYQNGSSDGTAVSLSDSTNSVRHIVLGGGHWDSVGLDQSNAKVKISTKVNGPVNVTSPLGNFGWSQFSGDATTISSQVSAAYGGVTGPDGAYETGTWSPVVSDAESGGNAATMSSDSFTYGRYTKIGNRVLIDGCIRISSSSGMTTSNSAFVTGLPIAPSSTGSALVGLAVCRAQHINTSNGDGDAIMASVRSTSTINFHIPVDSGADYELTVADIDGVSSSHFLSFSGHYVIN